MVALPALQLVFLLLMWIACPGHMASSALCLGNVLGILVSDMGVQNLSPFFQYILGSMVGRKEAAAVSVPCDCFI